MKRFCTFLSGLILLCFISTQVGAQKSRGALMYPHATQITQPDGSLITLKGNGDAIVNWLSTEKGYTVLRSKEGWYEYAINSSKGNLVSSGVRVTTAQNSADEIMLFNQQKPNAKFSKSQVEEKKSEYFAEASSKSPAKAFPTTGSRKVLLVLASFSDMPNQLTSTTFDNVMNQTNYNSTGSFRDFYLASSFNQLDLTTTVTVWVQLSNTHAYYGANDLSGNDLRPREFVREAVDSLEAQGFDFSPFDNDGDGYVDGIQVIHAGYGEEYGGADPNNIWSHRWSLSGQSVTYDGVTINDYAIYPELRGTSGTNPSNIGVICHEFGHSLGLPDYYDTDYSGSGGQGFDLGDWDLMSGGSWNNNGATPANNNAYSKAMLNWITLEELNSPVNNKTLNNAMENGEACIINTTTSNEFFVIENRQQVGYDTYIPYHGLLIFHVDLNHYGWGSNDINVDPSHQAMDIEEADNTQTSGSTSGDVYPGTSSVTSFTDATTPGSLAWDGSLTEKPITNIQESGGQITFDFMWSNSVATPTNFAASISGNGEVTLDWVQDAQRNDILLAFSTTNTFGTPIDGTAYTNGETIVGGGEVLVADSIEEFIHGNLSENTTYYYQIWSNDGSVYSDPAVDSVTTLCNATASFPYDQDFSTGSLPICWTIEDSIGNGQVWEFDNPGGYTLGSTSGANGFVILDSDNYGSGNNQNTNLYTPVFDFSKVDGAFISFEYYYRDYDGNDSVQLMVSTDFGTTWQILSSWDNQNFGSFATPAEFSMDVSDFVVGESSVMFCFNYVGSFGYYFAFDDFKVESTYSVSLLLTDADDTLIEGAEVNFNGEIVLSDENGITLIDSLDANTFSYTITHPLYYDSIASITVIDSNIVDTIVLIKKPVYNLTYNVLSGTTPIPEAIVNLDNVLIDTTDANGQVIFENVPENTFNYTVAISGFDPVYGTQIVDKDSVQDIQMTIRISEIQTPLSGELSPFVNDTLKTKGIVTAVGAEGYFIQNGLGDYSGIFVKDNVNAVTVGDSIIIDALVDETDNFTNLQNIHNFTITSNNNEILADTVPVAITLTEAYESVFVIIENAECSDTNFVNGEFTLTQGSSSIVVGDTIYQDTAILGHKYIAEGVISAFNGEIKLLPRTDADIIRSFKAFCYVTFTSTSLPIGPATINIPNVEVNSIADQSGSSFEFISGGSWAEGMWCGATYYDDILGTGGEIIRIDTITGERQVLATLGISFTATAYDWSTSTMFATTYEGSETVLYKVNLSDGQISQVGTTPELIINLACSADGSLFGIDINSDELCRIDKSTAATTVIGSIGFDANYAQDMEFDHYTGKLWALAYNMATGGELRLVDTITGNTTHVQDLSGQLTGFAIPFAIKNRANIVAFSFAQQTGIADIDQDNHTVIIEVAAGTNVQDLIASFILSEGATATINAVDQISGITANNFSEDLEYTIEAADGSIKTWTIIVNIAPSNNSNLARLNVDGALISGFIPSTITYNVELPFGTTIVPRVTAILQDTSATYTITDAASLPGSTTVVVDAEDGITSSTYTVNFTVALANEDATLSDLTIDAVSLSDFTPAVTDYLVVLPSGTTVVPTVAGIASSASATPVATQATNLTGNESERTATIVVTAEDGLTTKTYSVIFRLQSNVASLSDLALFGETIDGFASDVYSYIDTLPYGTVSVPLVEAFASHDSATVVISEAVSLPGTTTITVTAEDGVTELVYQIYFVIENTYDIGFNIEASGVPIEGATINFNGIQSQTSVSGFAVYLNNPAGTYSYSVVADGYYPTGGSITIEDKDSVYNINLDAIYYSATFTVIDPLGSPVEDASVVYNGISKLTPINGTVEFDSLINNTQNYIVSKNGYETNEGQIIIDGVDVSKTIQLVPLINEVYEIEFFVSDSLSNPLEGAIVSIGAKNAVSDENGIAKIVNLENGDYTYYVDANGYGGVNDTISINGTNKSLTVQLPKLHNLTFVVTDGQSGLYRANVSFNNSIYQTDINGWFSIDVVKGNYDYGVSLNQYHSNSGNIDVEKDTIVRINLVLVQYLTTFQVVDTLDQPIWQARIEFGANMYSTTSPQGLCYFNAINGTYNYQVSKQGYDTVIGSVNISNADISQKVVLKETKYLATFTVIDEDDLPLENATIVLDSEIQLQTNSEGIATYSLYAGTYNYTIGLNSYDTVTGQIIISDSDISLTQKLSLTQYVLKFNVKNVNNKNLNNVTIELDNGLTGTTNLVGDVEFNVLPDSYEYTVELAKYVSQSNTITITKDTTVNLIMEVTKYSANVNIFDEAGALLEGVLVELDNGEQASTNSSGQVIFILEPDNYSYTISKDEFVSKSGEFEVIDANIVVNDTIRAITFSLTFKVVDNDLLVLNDIEVVLKGIETQQTDVFGVCEFTNLPKGSYSYTISDSDFEKVDSNIDLVSDTTLLVQLIKTGVLNSKQNSFVVYPNPTKDICYINAKSGAELKVFDSTGKLILMQKMESNSVEVNLENQKSGLYYILIGINNRIETHTIVLE